MVCPDIVVVTQWSGVSRHKRLVDCGAVCPDIEVGRQWSSVSRRSGW